MNEMEETVTNEGSGNAVELTRWQQWRDTAELATGLNTTTGIGGTGSAARPIEIEDAAGTTATVAPGGARAEGGGGPLEETETLWGHAVHEHELSPGDQVCGSLA